MQTKGLRATDVVGAFVEIIAVQSIVAATLFDGVVNTEAKPVAAISCTRVIVFTVFGACAGVSAGFNEGSRAFPISFYKQTSVAP